MLTMALATWESPHLVAYIICKVSYLCLKKHVESFDLACEPVYETHLGLQVVLDATDRRLGKGKHVVCNGWPCPGKVDFGTGTGRKAFFDFFLARFWNPPPPTNASTAKKIHWYRPFFSPLHGLFREGGGLVLVYVFLSLISTRWGRY